MIRFLYIHDTYSAQTYRLDKLDETVKLLERHDISLLCESLDKLIPCSVDDDPGLFYFAGKFMSLTGLSSTQALAYLYSILCLAGVGVMMVFILILFKSFWGRIVGLASFFVLTLPKFFDYFTADVYAYVAILNQIIFFYFIVLFKVRLKWIWALASICIIGLLVGYADTLRSYSTFHFLLVAPLLVIFSQHYRALQKTLLLGLFFLSIIFTSIHFKFLNGKAVEKASELNPGVHFSRSGHPLWHNAYLGLGYIENPWGIHWKDEFAVNFVKQKDPRVKKYSSEYEHILKQEFFRIVREKPFYFVKVNLAKAKKIVSRFFKNLWLLLILLPLVGLEWPLLVALAFSLGFQSIPVFVGIPYNQYCSGVMAIGIVILFFIFVCGLFAEKYGMKPSKWTLFDYEKT